MREVLSCRQRTGTLTGGCDNDCNLMRLVLKIRTSVELIREGRASRHAEFSDAILDGPLKVSPLDIVRNSALVPQHTRLKSSARAAFMRDMTVATEM